MRNPCHFVTIKVFKVLWRHNRKTFAGIQLGRELDVFQDSERGLMADTKLDVICLVCPWKVLPDGHVIELLDEHGYF